MKNRRGDIPVTVLVIGTFAVFILALFSFYIVERKMSDNFGGPGLIETVKSLNEELKFDKNNKFGQFEIEEEKVFKKGLLEIEQRYMVKAKINPQGSPEIFGRYISREGIIIIINLKDKTLVTVEYDTPGN